MKKVLLIIFTLLLFYPFNNAYSGESGPWLLTETDEPRRMLFGYFDLRDRETSIQVTNSDSDNRVLHIQIFNVDLDCNENNFFDTYTPNDTHTYDMRNILTNDDNPSGVVLPENAYGIIVISAVEGIGQGFLSGANIFGNQRILDSAGYEYRTNLVVRRGGEDNEVLNTTINFNYNNNIGVTLSDVVGFMVGGTSNDDGEVDIDPAEQFWAVDVDIYNNNEVPFSCRNVIFACMDQDNPRLEELLERVGVASVASFEYGINDAIPHSRGSELLCPNNIIDEGIVRLRQLDDLGSRFILYIGLNNGNSRGSMDSYWLENRFIPDQPG